MKKFLLTLLLAIPANIFGQSVFDRYFVQAETFAKNFPREKVHLHFDNNSYYQGDTIWFKAYVIDEDSNRPSHISKPLYVELVDQSGNVMNRQIVRLDHGEGHGQISLADALFTGYYEVRAYTKWMLAFSDNPQYFSRTLPVYRRPLNPDEPLRSIAEYRMDKSMKQRPKEKFSRLDVRFFPEGGRLLRGQQSVVGFEILSEDSGWVNLTGYLLSAEGQRTMPVAALHDGMGSFVYTPGEKPSEIEFDYDGKTRRFRLPDADASGYTLTVSTKDESIDVAVSRSADLADSVALFVFTQAQPRTYIPIDFKGRTSRRIKILTSDLPGGVVRLSLVNDKGQTLSDRFCFVYPYDMPIISGKADNRFYAPFGKASCRLEVTDDTGRPVSGAHLSVAVRDALDTDILSDGSNIYTDLLFTSELKGYIDRPAFYLADRSVNRRRMLDNLMIIRGWRKYDPENQFGLKPFRPKYIPESKLNLDGHIDSWYGKSQAGIGITILAQRDSLYITGSTHADSLGNFTVPLDDFYGRMEALIQTRREGKKFNRNSMVSLFRNFGPPLRQLDYRETNPVWDIPKDTVTLSAALDSFEKLAADSGRLTIDEVVVRGKFRRRSLLKDTEKFERDILGFYNIRQIVDRMRDEGKFVADDVPYLMHTINNRIDREGTVYGVNPLKFSANGHDIKIPFLKGCVDMIETAMLYIDRTGLYFYKIGKNYRVDVDEMTDIYTGNNAEMDTVSQANLRKMFVRCALQMSERWDAGKSYAPTHGIRRTEIQGYSTPAEFYSPRYNDATMRSSYDDRRRTLYWNPSVVTDKDGVATVECYNGRRTTYLNVSAETFVDGKPAAVNFSSY